MVQDRSVPVAGHISKSIWTAKVVFHGFKKETKKENTFGPGGNRGLIQEELGEEVNMIKTYCGEFSKN